MDLRAMQHNLLLLLLLLLLPLLYIMNGSTIVLFSLVFLLLASVSAFHLRPLSLLSISKLKPESDVRSECLMRPNYSCSLFMSEDGGKDVIEQSSSKYIIGWAVVAFALVFDRCFSGMHGTCF